MARLFSKADYARLRGCSRPYVTKLTQTTLKPALTAGKINVDHPAAQADLAGAGVTAKQVGDAARWGTRRGKDAKKKPAPPPARRPPKPIRVPAAPPPRPDPPPPPPLAPEVPMPEDLKEIEADLELVRPILEKHGHVGRYNSWLNAALKLLDVQKKWIANEEAEGRLIERELVKSVLIGEIEEFLVKLLRDFPKGQTIRQFNLAHAKAEIEQGEREMRESLRALILPMKHKLAKVLGAEP